MGRTTTTRKANPAPSAPAQPASTSTFATPADPVYLTFGVPQGFVTEPNSDGACALKVVEDKLHELGYPADACHLYIIDDALQAFPNLTELQKASIRQNGAIARGAVFGQAILWQGYRLGKALGNGNYEATKILPDTFAFRGYRAATRLAPESKAFSLADLAAFVATWTLENYPRRPDIGQPSVDFFNTSGYGA